MSKNRKVASLQNQYVISSLLVGTIAIVAALLTYAEIIKNSTRLTSRASEISQLLEHSTTITSNISQVDKAVDTFMIEPERNEQRTIVTQKLENTSRLINYMRNRPTIIELTLDTQLSTLSNKIIQLDEASEKLFTIRLSAIEQFPSLEVSSRLMRPVRNKLYTAFSVAVQEMREENPGKASKEFYDLIDAQSLWLRTISEYRLYLTNRFGSFSEQTMFNQERQIEDLVNQLKVEINKIARYAENDSFGFEGNEMILTLPQLVNDWDYAYNEVKKINHSSQWRRDSELMRTTMIPLKEDILFLLEKIDSKLKSENQKIMLLLNETARSQTYVLAGIITAFLLYTLISIILLKTLLIKPISLIAKTLKEGAHNPSSLENIQLNKTRETADLIEAFTTMGQQVASRQEELVHHALHDALTTLPNRSLLNQRLEYQSLIARRESTKFTLMFLDLNRFKEINDTLGHHIGDELLIQTSERFSSLIREVDTIARLGGDEFAVLLPNTERSQAVIVALKIAAILKQDFIIQNYTLQVSSSIGIAEFPDDGDDVNTLIQHADIAMYASKKNKSVYEFYDQKEDTHSLAQLSLGRDLSNAIDNNQLEMHFQPKINLSNCEINGAEALLRWHHPKFGDVNPEKIIELAEHVDLMDKLTYWIINQSILNCSHRNLPDNFDLSINLAVQSLRDSNLIVETRKAIESNPAFKYRLTFEVTESAMMNNPEQSINILNALKKLGIRISIDDFGTGFSSLAYLKQLPVSQLKIDRSFVMDMQNDESDKAIVLSTINLSHSLGLDVVAEGVEDRETANILKDMECNSAQGYHFSKPLDAKTFHQYVINYNAKDYS